MEAASPDPGRERPWLRLVGIAVIMPAVVVVALLVARSDGNNRVVSTGSGRQGPVPVAAPPLLPEPPTSTPPVQVAAGTAGGAAWSLWAKISPMDVKRPQQGTGQNSSAIPSFGPGLDMEVVTPEATGGGGGDPTRMDSLVVADYGPLPGFPAELVYGVTSARAAGVQIILGDSGSPIKASLESNPRFPGLRFYTAVAPASASSYPIAAKAVAADGTPLLETAAKKALPLRG